MKLLLGFLRQNMKYLVSNKDKMMKSISEQIQELRELPDDFCEKSAPPFLKNELDWLQNVLIGNKDVFGKEFYISPAHNGLIIVEWEKGDAEISIDIDLNDHSAKWNELHLDSDYELTDVDLSLDDNNWWNWMRVKMENM